MFGKGSFLRKKSEDESSSETRALVSAWYWALSKTSGEISKKTDDEPSSESGFMLAAAKGLMSWAKSD